MDKLITNPVDKVSSHTFISRKRFTPLSSLDNCDANLK